MTHFVGLLLTSSFVSIFQPQLESVGLSPDSVASSAGVRTRTVAFDDPTLTQQSRKSQSHSFTTPLPVVTRLDFLQPRSTTTRPSPMIPSSDRRHGSLLSRTLSIRPTTQPYLARTTTAWPTVRSPIESHSSKTLMAHSLNDPEALTTSRKESDPSPKFFLFFNGPFYFSLKEPLDHNPFPLPLPALIPSIPSPFVELSDRKSSQLDPDTSKTSIEPSEPPMSPDFLLPNASSMSKVVPDVVPDQAANPDQADVPDQEVVREEAVVPEESVLDVLLPYSELLQKLKFIPANINVTSKMETPQSIEKSNAEPLKMDGVLISPKLKPHVSMNDTMSGNDTTEMSSPTMLKDETSEMEDQPTTFEKHLAEFLRSFFFDSSESNAIFLVITLLVQTKLALN